MKGLTLHGAQNVLVEDVDDPTLERPTDALVRVTLAGICGSDLHFYNAAEAFGFPPGSRLGHEFVGVVEAVGDEVADLAPGDRVLSSVSVACGECRYCREGLQSSCVQWSIFGQSPRLWRHGGAPQGGQSEYVRVPLAQTTLHRVPDELADADDAALVAICDMMSTGWHGLTKARVRQGDAVAVIGDGAVGLAAVHGARAMGAERIVCLGHHPDRLEVARALGATAVVDSRDAEEIRELTLEASGGDGAHAVIDTISGTSSMESAHAVVRPGGSIAALGMDHFMGKTPQVNWYDQFVRNISVTGGLVPGGAYIPILLGQLAEGRIAPAPLFTHRLPIAEGPEGYRMMNDRVEGVIKVAVAPGA